MYSIVPLEKSKFTEALDFVCQEFTANSVLHKDSGVKLEEYTNYLRKPFLEMAAENLSFLALEHSTKKIVGCLLAGDYANPHKTDSAIPIQILPINALIRELELCYAQKRTITAGTTLIVDIAVVTRSARGQGVYFKLREQVHRAAAAIGFQRVVGELSSTPPQKMCVEKLGHKVVCEIEYKTFRYEDRFPFDYVQEPKSIQLVEGVLANETTENSAAI